MASYLVEEKVVSAPSREEQLFTRRAPAPPTDQDGARPSKLAWAASNRAARAKAEGVTVLRGAKGEACGVLSWNKVQGSSRSTETSNVIEVTFATNEVISREAIELPAPVVLACGGEPTPYQSRGPSARSLELYFLCQDGFMYRVRYQIAESSSSFLELVFDPNGWGCCDLREKVSRDAPTCAVYAAEGQVGGGALVLIGKASGNVSAACPSEDFWCPEENDDENDNGGGGGGGGGIQDAKEPLMRRLLGGLGSSKEKAAVGIHPIGSGLALVAHASGAVRLWECRDRQFGLRGEVQAPAIEEDDTVELLGSTCQTFASYGGADGNFALLCFDFSVPRRGCAGLLALQLVLTPELGMHKFAVLTLPGEYAAVNSVCATSMEQLCVVFRRGEDGGSCLKSVEISSSGAPRLVDVKERWRRELGWVPTNSASNFEISALLPWDLEGGETLAIQDYVKSRLLDGGRVCLDALAAALEEVGGRGSRAEVAGLSAAAGGAEAANLFPFVSTAIDGMAPGPSGAKAHHWLHFLAVYSRYWRQQRSVRRLALARAAGKPGEETFVITVNNDGSLGLLREADPVERMEFWGDSGADEDATVLRRAVAIAEGLLGTWGAGVCAHLAALGESPEKIAARAAKACVQGRSAGGSDELDRERLSRRLRERRQALFELNSTMGSLRSLEGAVGRFLEALGLRRTGELGEPGSGGGADLGLAGRALGSTMETLCASRIELFVNFSVALRLYGHASQASAQVARVCRAARSHELGNLQTARAAHTVASLSCRGGRMQNRAPSARRVRLLPGSKTRKAQSEGPQSHFVPSTIAEALANTKLWSWGRDSEGTWSLVGRALALCESMAVHGDGGTEVMALKLTNALHGLGQTAAIHKVLKGCSLVAAHSPEHRFVEGLACCAGGGAGDAMAAFFSAVSGISSHGSEDLKEGLRQLKHELQGTRAMDMTTEMSEFTRLDYYRTITLLFRRVGNLKGAVQFTLAAMAEVRDSVPDQGKLWTTLFDLFLDLKSWPEAYAAIVANPVGTSAIAALHTLVITLFEAGEVRALCDLPLVGNRFAEKGGKMGKPAFYLTEVENALLWHCDHMSLDEGTNPYLPLYAFHTKNHKHRCAAGVLLRYCRRVESGECAENFSVADAKSHHRALLLAHNSLSLAPEDHRWLDSPDFVHHNHHDISRGHEAPPAGLRRVVTIDDLRCELLRSRARLWCCELCRDQPAWAHFSGQRTDEECGELLARRGRYDLVTELAAALPKDMARQRAALLETAARELARHCVAPAFRPGVEAEQDFQEMSEQPQAQDPKWAMLKQFLSDFDGPGTSRLLRLTVVDTLLTERRNLCLPQWLLDSFKSELSKTKSFAGYSDLILVLAKHGLAEEAAAVACEMLGSWRIVLTDPRERQKPFAVCPPYNAIDALLAKLEQGQGGGAGEAAASVRTALERHLTAVAKESAVVVSSSN